jgi:hypothetical protein
VFVFTSVASLKYPGRFPPWGTVADTNGRSLGGIRKGVTLRWWVNRSTFDVRIMSFTHQEETRRDIANSLDYIWDDSDTHIHCTIFIG